MPLGNASIPGRSNHLLCKFAAIAEVCSVTLYRTGDAGRVAAVRHAVALSVKLGVGVPAMAP